jgi:colicin import membrane protein
MSGRFCLLLLAFALHAPVRAQTPEQAAPPGTAAHASQERMRITAQRKSIEDAFAAEQAACYKRFAVNDCLQDSRVRRRDALADLRRQEVSLNDADRKQRGAQQTRKVEDKASTQNQEQTDAQRRKKEEAQQRRQLDAQDNAARRARLKEQAPAKEARRQKESQRQREALDAKVKRAAQNPANAQQFEAKQKEAEQHKAEVEAKRSKKTKPAAQPLPPPP